MKKVVYLITCLLILCFVFSGCMFLPFRAKPEINLFPSVTVTETPESNNTLNIIEATATPGNVVSPGIIEATATPDTVILPDITMATATAEIIATPTLTLAPVTTSLPTAKPTATAKPATPTPTVKPVTPSPTPQITKLPNNLSLFVRGHNWRTNLNIKTDGTFTGDFFHHARGAYDDVIYENGVEYYSDFYGRFKNIKKVDEYTYTFTLDYVKYKEPFGKTYVEDDCLYVVTEPESSFSSTKPYFTLYLPGTPTGTIASDAIMDWESIFSWYDYIPSELPNYALYNKNNCTFFSLIED